MACTPPALVQGIKCEVHKSVCYNNCQGGFDAVCCGLLPLAAPWGQLSSCCASQLGALARRGVLRGPSRGLRGLLGWL